VVQLPTFCDVFGDTDAQTLQLWRFIWNAINRLSFIVMPEALPVQFYYTVQV